MKPGRSEDSLDELEKEKTAISEKEQNKEKKVPRAERDRVLSRPRSSPLLFCAVRVISGRPPRLLVHRLSPAVYDPPCGAVGYYRSSALPSTFSRN